MRHLALAGSIRVFDAGAPVAIEQQARGLGVAEKRQVRTVQRGREIGGISGMPPAIADVRVMPTRPLHIRPVEIGGLREAEFETGINEGL